MNLITKKTAYGRYAALVDLATGLQTSLLLDEVRIGRSRENDIVLESDLTASRKQARITRVGDCYFLEDLASTNGTLLNGKQIHGRVLLNHDDVLNLGRRIYLFSMVEPVTEDAPTVNLGDGSMVSIFQSAHRMVSEVLSHFSANKSYPARSMSYAESLAKTVPQSGTNRLGQGKLFASALKQYQKRKQMPSITDPRVHVHR